VVKMLLFVKKNLENEPFSLKEIESILQMIKKEYKIENYKKYLLIEVDTLAEKEIEFLKKRIAYNKEIGIVLLKGDKVYHKPLYPIRVLPCKNIKDMLNILDRRGFILDINTNNLVRCYDNIIYEVIKEVKESEFQERKGQKKPGFMPFSLHPRLSKALYNVAMVKEKDIVLDSFCGVAGTIIEGELIGVKGICLEKYKKVCEKAYVNMKYYLNKADNLVLGDATQMPFKNKIFDAIISDLPYGRSTKLENKEDLYTKFFNEMKRVLKEGKKVVIITDINNLEEIYDIDIEYKTSFYVHKSLTRWLYVIKV